MKSIRQQNLAGCLFALIAFVLPHLCHSSEKTDGEPVYSETNLQFSRFSTDFYRQLLAQNRFEDIKNVNALLDRATYLYSNGRIPDAIGIILKNIDTVRLNINSKPVIGIVDLLLQANETNSADKLLSLIKQESDPSLVSNIQYLFAKYHYQHNDWNPVVEIIQKIANDLPAREYQHALFIQGLSLQALHRHREAITAYKKIPENSIYYVESRLNIAIADFRQDWWTDAHIIINDLLKNPLVKKDTPLADRLYTTIGYSFLQLEYFRNSRDAFRNVSLNSAFTNQALLGVALDAAYQKDYIGALNAARILNQKQGTDLESFESYLLLPYFYEKLHQNATASAGYTSAIKYYEHRLKTINSAFSSNDSIYLDIMKTSPVATLSLYGESLDLSGKLPPSFFSQLKMLNIYRKYIQSEMIHADSLHSVYKKTYNIFLATLKTKTEELLKKRSVYISDYMNQCRYGLARLYDSTKQNDG